MNKERFLAGAIAVYAAPAGESTAATIAVMPDDIPVKKAPIDLDQFLKLAGVVASGGEAKYMIGEGFVTVNDEPESRRRRKLAIGDVVNVEGAGAFCVAEAE